MASANKATILDQLQETATRIKQYILQQISDLSDAVMAAIPETYAGSAEAGGVADKAAAIPYGHVDSTSTATAYTATIDGITELVDGTTVLLKNGVVTSKAGFTININGLGAKPVYNNMAAASAETTIFNVAYTLLLVYDSTRVSGGCWINYRGYYSDANTVPTGFCTTAAGTAAKVATCNYGYRDDDNYFPCLFRYENTAANATLAISSYATTAAPIYVNGSRTSASNTFGRGVILFLYHDGAYYCYNDGRFPIVVDGAVTSVQEYVATKYEKPSGGIPKTDLASDVQASLGKADTALQADSLKTINGESLVGSGDITISGSSLPAVTSADTGKVLMVVNGAWAADSLPVYNGEIYTPTYTVTVSLTNPINANYFRSCYIYTIPDESDPGTYGEQIGSISSPSGSAEVSVSEVYGIAVQLNPMAVLSIPTEAVTCTGGVSKISISNDTVRLMVTGDGTVVIDRVNWDD